MRQCRYQWWGPNGIQWTQWFNIPEGAIEHPWEVKNKLKAEYRDAPVDNNN